MNDGPPSASRLEDLTHAYIEPVVARAGFLWNVRHKTSDHNREQSILFEAEPEKFARRYPHLMPDHGARSVPCIDLWIKRLPANTGLDVTLENIHLVLWLRARGEVNIANIIEDHADLEESIRAVARGLGLLLADHDDNLET